MLFIWIGVVLLVVAVTVVILRRPAPRAATGRGTATLRSASPLASDTPATPAATPAHAPAATPPRTAAPVAAGRAAPPVEAPMPPALASLHLVRAAELPEDRRQAYATTFQNVPRPPKLMHHLLSPDFVNTASSAQLVDLITAEPLIAAKVLSAVNSSTYGLKSPVGSIGQAVTYLGLNTVRSVCLQYILIATFTTDSDERRAMLDAAWTASAIASELTQKVSQRLDLEDRGSLVSAVVLSFLGRIGTTATVSREMLPTLMRTGLLARTVAEQDALGISASQIGRVLMADWGLPEQVVEDASDIDEVLVRPAADFAPERGSRLAICYLCARLGERLAEGTIADLSQFDDTLAGDAEFHQLRSYAAHPKVAKALQVVRSPDVVASMQQMLAAMRA